MPRPIFILRRASPPEARRIRRRSSHCCGMNGFTGSGCWRVCWALPQAPSSGP